MNEKIKYFGKYIEYDFIYHTLGCKLIENAELLKNRMNYFYYWPKNNNRLIESIYAYNVSGFLN